MSFLSRSTFAPPRSVPRLTRFRTRSHEALGKTTCTRKSTILPNDTAIIPQSGFALQGGQVSPVWGKSMPNHQEPLILLAQIAICPESRSLLPRLRLPRRNPPPPAASRTPARPSAPFHAASARVVLALRATTKSGSLKQLRTPSECYKGGPSLRGGPCEATIT